MTHDFLSFVIAIVIAAFGPSLVPLAAQSTPPEPLTKAKIMDGLTRGAISPTRMATLVRERGVDFSLTPEIEKDLRNAGADDALIQAISKAKVQQKAALVIDADADCTVTVNGTSFEMKAGEEKVVVAAVGENVVRAVSKRDSSGVWRKVVQVQPSEQKVVLIELGTEPQTTPATGDSPEPEAEKAPPVESHNSGAKFQVYHFHGALIQNSDLGLLAISNRRLQYTEYGERARPDHNFNVPCSEIADAGTNSFNPRSGWFHIRLRTQNYNFAAVSWQRPDQQQTKLILKAVAECRGKSDKRP